MKQVLVEADNLDPWLFYFRPFLRQGSLNPKNGPYPLGTISWVFLSALFVQIISKAVQKPVPSASILWGEYGSHKRLPQRMTREPAALIDFFAVAAEERRIFRQPPTEKIKAGGRSLRLFLVHIIRHFPARRRPGRLPPDGC